MINPKKIKYVKGFPVPKGYAAITFPPFGIYVREEYRDNERLLRHEMIHWMQCRELWYIFQYILYGVFYVINIVKYRSHDKAYRNNPFEREAFRFEWQEDYLEKRPRFNWVKS